MRNRSRQDTPGASLPPRSTLGSALRNRSSCVHTMDELYPVYFECPDLDVDREKKILLYFRVTRKSGGGECGSLINVSDQLYSVAFRERQVQQRVLQKPKHVLELGGRPVVLAVRAGPEPHSCPPVAPPAPGQSLGATLDPSQQKQQGAVASSLPPSGEEYELRPDPYLLRYLKDQPVAKKKLEQELASVGCSAQFCQDEGWVLVRSVAQPGAVDEGRNWKTEVDNLFHGYLCHYEADPRKVKALHQSHSSGQTTDEVEVYKEVGLAVVVGKRSRVETKLTDVNDLTVKLQGSRLSEKQASIRRLGEAKLRLLWKKIEHGLGQRFPGVRVIQGEAGQVVLEGSVWEILEAGDWISAEENLVLERTVSNMSPHLLAFLRKAYGGPRALGDFLGVGDNLEVELRDTELCFFSLSADELEDTAKKMQEMFKEVKIDLPPSPIVPSELQEKLKSKMNEVNPGQCRAQFLFGPDSTLCLLGHTEDVDKLIETVMQFILDQSSTEGKVNLPFPELVQHLTELLLLHNFDCSGVTLHSLTSSSGPMVVLQGTLNKVTEVRNRLGPFLDTLVQSRVIIDLPGAVRYFESPSGREAILRVAHSQQCLIQHQTQPPIATPNLASVASLSNGGTVVAGYNLRGGLQVLVCHGDITKQDVDVIINAANESLDHRGGVAAALRKAGGPEVQQESNDFVKKTGKLVAGDIALTTGGSLSCKKVFHVVGPVVGKAGGRERIILETAVQSALNKAEMMAFKSVAMPCISSGVFGVPVSVCSEAIVSAVKTFCAQEWQSLRKIILIDNRGEVVRAMQDACDRLLQTMCTGKSTPSDLGFLMASAAAADQDTTRGATAGPPGHGVHVEIVQGTIQTQQADGLVSPMAGHDPLSTLIGHNLLAVVGPQLTTKFYEDAGGATFPGDIVLVEGVPSFQFKGVIFLNLLSWDNKHNGTAVQVLRQCIRKTLEFCDIKGYTSVAFPVLGTGNVLHFPHSTAARVLLEEVHVFEQNRAKRSSLRIRIIIHPKDKESSKAFLSAQDTMHLRGFTNCANPVHASIYRHVSTTNDEVTAMLGKVKLQMVQGDIINGGTDIIVNTTDFSNNHTGVSKAILTAAGPAVQADLAQVGIPTNFMCTTGPGFLGCREIIHASFKSDPQVIRKNCKKILKQCESKGYHSVAFPAINTGAAGMDAVKACRAMLDGMVLAIKDITPVSLSLIRIVILQQPVFHAFRSVLENRPGQIAPSRFNLKEKAKQALKKRQERNSRASTSSAQQVETFISSKPQPAVLSVVCCGPDIIAAIKTDLEGILQKQLVEREVDVYDFSRLDAMELEAVVAKVRVLGISLEHRRRRRSESLTDNGTARDRLGSGGEVYVLKGLKEDVLSVTELVNRAVHEALCNDLQDKKEAMLALSVQWSIQDTDGVWQELSLQDNYVLEDALRNKQVSAEVTAPDGMVVSVNLRTQEATNWETGTTYKVKRSEAETTLDLPTQWEPMHEEVFKKVELPPNSQEYQTVAQGFHKTAKFKILKIERVQNLYLWQAYSVCKQRLLVKNGPADIGEMTLYHGTTAESCNCIERDRFDRSFAGKNAALYGKGVYFAVNAEYSASKFSPPDASGLKRLYVARVLTGRYTLGNRDMKAPPPRGRDTTDCFDSLVDNQLQPSMFVIFRDDQAYPEHLITFK